MYTQDIRAAFEDVSGNGGACKRDFAYALSEAKKAVDGLNGRRRSNAWPVLNVPEYKDDFMLIEQVARHINDSFDTMIVLGMGASGRSGSALAALASNRFDRTAGKTRIHFLDNIDPHTFDQLQASLALKNTVFLVISKSGSTVETIGQLLILLHEVRDRIGRNEIKNHFIFITEPGINPMRRLGEEHGITTLKHDPNICGRFAALTAVGLLPAKVAGLDIRAIRQGAAEVTRRTLAGEALEPAIGAALHDALLKKGKSVAVMMPYCDRLHEFSAWHQQLWVESLGKNGRGTTALRALGPFDQHSQLQFYLDGPPDKFITLITLRQEEAGAAVPPLQDKALSYLGEHTIGNLVVAQQSATARILAEKKCPLRVFSLSRLSEETMGALLMHFMLETMITAQLWKVDAFDQPAMDEGKRLARDYLMADMLRRNIASDYDVRMAG